MNVIVVVAQESGEPGAVLPHPSELVIGFLAFATLVYVVMKYAWPLFTKSYTDHNARVTDGMEQADEAQRRAQEELGKRRTELAGVDGDTARIRDDARAEAERIKEDMAQRAREEADRIVAQGRQTLDASRSRTVSELRGEVGHHSVELARRIVASSLADDDRRGESVDGFLDQLEEMAGGGSDAGTDDGSGTGTVSAPVGARRAEPGNGTSGGDRG